MQLDGQFLPTGLTLLSKCGLSGVFKSYLSFNYTSVYCLNVNGLMAA